MYVCISTILFELHNASLISLIRLHSEIIKNLNDKRINWMFTSCLYPQWILDNFVLKMFKTTGIQFIFVEQDSPNFRCQTEKLFSYFTFACVFVLISLTRTFKHKHIFKEKENITITKKKCHLLECWTCDDYTNFWNECVPNL